MTRHLLPLYLVIAVASSPAAGREPRPGDGDAAIAWIQSIPERFRSASLAADPVFAPIKDRADFRALFPPR